MDDVTDTVLRQMFCTISRPDVFFTEFTSVEALCNKKGRDHALPRLKFAKFERPIVAQIWGINPEFFYQTAKDLSQMGFDGIDINMGCPESRVLQKGTCAALIKNHQLAKEIIEATIKGAGGLPVSVKTRLGLQKIETEEWIGFLLGFPLAAISIHGRTAKEMSKVSAHWDEIKKAADLRNQLNPDVLIIGNGDVLDRLDGLEKIKESGIDGIMIGRGIFKNVWAFDQNPRFQRPLKRQLDLVITHAKLFEAVWGKTKNFASLRKFFKSYIHAFPGASDLRTQLVQTNSLKEVAAIIKNFKIPA